MIGSDDRRYQLFVSSTFDDLQEERQKVLQAVLEMKAFPASSPCANGAVGSALSLAFSASSSITRFCRRVTSSKSSSRRAFFARTQDQPRSSRTERGQKSREIQVCRDDDAASSGGRGISTGNLTGSAQSFHLPKGWRHSAGPHRYPPPPGRDGLSGSTPCFPGPPADRVGATDTSDITAARSRLAPKPGNVPSVPRFCPPVFQTLLSLVTRPTSTHSTTKMFPL